MSPAPPPSPSNPPQLSVVVVGSRMRRELPRTVASLAPDYQRLDAQHYEIELAEQPSDAMLTAADRADFPPNLTHTAETETVSLAVAVNRAVRRTRGSHILICVDGARILSAGILQRCRQAIRLNPRAVMAVHALHLGQRPQPAAVAAGTHSARIEDALLEDIAFPAQPQQLFAVSCWADPSRHGWFGPMREASALMVPRDLFEALGGYDEAAALSASLASSDFYSRAIADPTRPLVVPLGEATFRQHRDGPVDEHGAFVDETGHALHSAFAAEAGRPFVPPSERAPLYIGNLQRPHQNLALGSMIRALRGEDGQRPVEGAKALARLAARAGEPLARTAPRAPLTLIVGMHRSGTSFLARQMVRNGFVMPGMPMPGSVRSNPDGHYEPLELVAWHNALLAELGLSWSALGRTGLAERGAAFIDRHAATLQRLLVELDTGGAAGAMGTATGTGETTPGEMDTDAAGWVLKDPRICRAVPVWQRAAARMGIAPTHLLILRDPSLVAASLHKRDGFGRDFARLLWARYVQDMLTLAASADDVLCLDGADGEAVAAYVARRTGRAGFACQPVVPRPLAPAADPITALYRAFLETRDLDAFRAGIDAELAFLDRYPETVARLDRLAGLPDTM